MDTGNLIIQCITQFTELVTIYRVGFSDAEIQELQKVPSTILDLCFCFFFVDFYITPQ